MSFYTISNQGPCTETKPFKDAYKKLYEGGLEMPANDPVLGDTNEIVVFQNFDGLWNFGETIHTLLIDKDTKTLLGIAFSIPLQEMSVKNTKLHEGCAYIYGIAVKTKYQNQGLSKMIIQDHLKLLYHLGYTQAEIDCVLEGGFGDSFLKYIRKMEEKGDHEILIYYYDHRLYDEIGPQRCFRINLESYKFAPQAEGGNLQGAPPI